MRIKYTQIHAEIYDFLELLITILFPKAIDIIFCRNIVSLFDQSYSKINSNAKKRS